MRGTIYVIKNEVNGKYYVGQTRKDHPKERFNQHKRLSRMGKGYILHAAMRKYGENKFKLVETIDADWDKLNEIERETIVRYNSCQPTGYNILEWGSISNLSEGWWKGKDRGQEYANKISRIKKEQYEALSEEQKEALKERGRQAHTKYDINKVCIERWDSMTGIEKKETTDRINKARLEYLSNEALGQKTERYKKISEHHKNSGIKPSEEAVAKAAKINSTRVRSEEERVKRIAALKGVPKKNKENYKKAQLARRTPEQLQRVLDIRKYLTEGLSGVEIAKRIGCTPEYVYKVRKGERGRGI